MTSHIKSTGHCSRIWTRRLMANLLLRNLKIVTFAIILFCAINSVSGVCVWQRGGGFRLACGFRQSGLFRLRSFGGLKGWAGAGFTIGDEDGFKDSLTNAETKKQQLQRQQQQQQTWIQNANRGVQGMQQQQQQQQPQRGLFGILPQRTQQNSIFNNPLFGSHSNINVQQAAATPEDLAVQALKDLPLAQLEMLQKQQQQQNQQEQIQLQEAGQPRPVRVVAPAIPGNNPGIVSAQVPILPGNSPAGAPDSAGAAHSNQKELSRVGLQKRASLWHWPLSLFQKRQPQQTQQVPIIPGGFAPPIRGGNRRGPFNRPSHLVRGSSPIRSNRFPMNQLQSQSPVLEPQRQGLPFYGAVEEPDPLIAEEAKNEDGRPYGLKILEGSENYGQKFTLQQLPSPLGPGEEDLAATAGYDTNIFPDIYFTTTTPKNKLAVPDKNDRTTTLKKNKVLKKVKVIKHRGERRKQRKRKKQPTIAEDTEPAEEMLFDETTVSSTSTSKSTPPSSTSPTAATSPKTSSTTEYYEPEFSESTSKATVVPQYIMSVADREEALRLLYSLGITTTTTTTTPKTISTPKTPEIPKSEVVVKLINPLINNGYDPRFPPDHPVNRKKIELLTTTTTTKKPFFTSNNFYNPKNHFSKSSVPLFPKPDDHEGYVKLDSTETVNQMNKTKSYNSQFYSHFNRTLVPFDLKVDDAYLYNAATTKNYPQKLLPEFMNANYWTPAASYYPETFTTTVASTLKVASTTPFTEVRPPSFHESVDRKPNQIYNTAPSGYYTAELNSKHLSSSAADTPVDVYKNLDSRQESSNGVYKSLDSGIESAETRNVPLKTGDSAESSSGETGSMKTWTPYKSSKFGASEGPKFIPFKPNYPDAAKSSAAAHYWTEKTTSTTTPAPTSVPWWRTSTTTTPRPPTPMSPTPPRWWRTTTTTPRPSTILPWRTTTTTQKTTTTEEPETTKRSKYHRKRYRFKVHPTPAPLAPTTVIPTLSENEELEPSYNDPAPAEQAPSREDSYEPEVPQFKYASRLQPSSPPSSPPAPTLATSPSYSNSNSAFRDADQQEEYPNEYETDPEIQNSVVSQPEPEMEEPEEETEPPTAMSDSEVILSGHSGGDGMMNSQGKSSEEPKFKVISEQDLSETSQGFVSPPGAGINKLLSEVATLAANAKKSVGLRDKVYFNDRIPSDQVLKLSFVSRGEPLDLGLGKPSEERPHAELEEMEENVDIKPSTFRPHMHHKTMRDDDDNEADDDDSIKQEADEPEYAVMPPILPENRYRRPMPEDFRKPVSLPPVDEEENDNDDEQMAEASYQKPTMSEQQMPVPSSVFKPPMNEQTPQESYPYTETERMDLPTQDLSPPLYPAQAEELMKPVDAPESLAVPAQSMEPPGPSDYQRYGPFQTEKDVPSGAMLPPSPAPTGGFKGLLASLKPSITPGTRPTISSQHPGMSGIFKHMLSRAPSFLGGSAGAQQFYQSQSSANATLLNSQPPQQPMAPYLVHPSNGQFNMGAGSNSMPIAVPFGQAPPPGAKLIAGPPPGAKFMAGPPPGYRGVPGKRPQYNAGPPPAMPPPAGSPPHFSLNSYSPSKNSRPGSQHTGALSHDPSRAPLQNSYHQPPSRFPGSQPQNQLTHIPSHHHNGRFSLPSPTTTTAPTSVPKAGKPLSEKETVLKALETLSKVKTEVIQSIVHEKLGVKAKPITKPTTTTTPVPPQLHNVASKLAPLLANQKQMMASQSNKVFSISTDAISSLFTTDEEKKAENELRPHLSPELEAQINASFKEKQQQIQQLQLQQEILKRMKLSQQKPNPQTTAEPTSPQQNQEIIRTLSQIANRLKSPDALSANRTYSPAQIETMRKLLVLNKLEDALKAQNKLNQDHFSINRVTNDWKPKVNSLEIPSNVLQHKIDQATPASYDQQSNMANAQQALLALKALALKKAQSLNPAPEVSVPQQAKPRENRLIQGGGRNSIPAVDLSAILASPSPILLKFPEPSLSNNWMPRSRLIDVKNAPKSFYPGDSVLKFDTNDNMYTDFRCEDQKYFPGLYADPTLSCKVFHLCAKSEAGYVRKTFRCPQETVFDQEVLRCNWNLYVDCSAAESKYNFNKYLSQSFQFLRILGEFSASYKPRNATSTHT